MPRSRSSNQPPSHAIALCGGQRVIGKRCARDVQGAALLALVGQIKLDSLLQGREQLVQAIAGSEAAGKLGHVGPVAALLDVDASGQFHSWTSLIVAPLV